MTAIRNGMIAASGKILRRFFPQRSAPADPKTIIVLKPCCLGDVVLATPTIAALQARYPQAKIDAAVGRWSRAALENNPHIRQLLDTGRVGQGQYGWADVRRLAKRLRRQRYDLSVTLDRSPVVGLAPWLAGIKHRVGLDSAERGFAHTLRVPVPAAAMHEAAIYLRCVAALGGESDGVWAAFYPSEADKRNLPSLTRPFVIIHPAGGMNPGMKMPEKRWPVERLADLGNRFARRGLAVVLTGAANDAPLCREVAAQMAGLPPKILAGSLTLGQFGALCQQASLFVGADTGAMHIAAATGCKTVAIFGPSDPQRYGPFAPPEKAIALWRPVSLPKGGVGQGKVFDFSWEQGVSVEEAWDACEQFLSPESLPSRKLF
ncbi:MAG TPA: glycosyltransferase family 9 protein [Anaerolineae bacterium]|nr:glycosyltransferase family 9 protein [Anaerolineae bacterium]